MNAIITLTTDFGLADAYVAAMKAVILSINPEAKLIDITHHIKPQSIREAAFVLSTVYDLFPARTIHLVVVDPGVGTQRKAIILRTPSADFVAPDNGVLSYALQQISSRPVDVEHQQIELGAELEAVSITRSKYWRATVSSTFHGRDIFAPVAAHLSLGVPLKNFGERITSLTAFPLPRPRLAKNALIGEVLHIDNFGNLITSIRRDDLPSASKTITVKIGNKTISGLSRTYQDNEGLLALIGSSDYLEISLRNGSAGDFLKSKVGDEVRVELNE